MKTPSFVVSALPNLHLSNHRRKCFVCVCLCVLFLFVVGKYRYFTQKKSVSQDEHSVLSHAFKATTGHGQIIPRWDREQWNESFRAPHRMFIIYSLTFVSIPQQAVWISRILKQSLNVPKPKAATTKKWAPFLMVLPQVMKLFATIRMWF